MGLPIFSARGYHKQTVNEPLFFTVFGSGVTLGALETMSPDPGTRCVQTLSGTDSVTGYSYTTDLTAAFGAGATISTLAVPNLAIASADYGTYFANSIEATTDPYAPVGSRQLSTSVLARVVGNNSNPQSNLTIVRAQAPTLTGDLAEYYIRERMLIPAGLNLTTGQTNGNFFELIEKKDGYGIPGKSDSGDHRIKFELRGDTGTIKYQLTVDNKAGTTAPTETYYPNASIDQTPNDTVRLGVWHTLHLYFKQAPVEDPTNGFLQAVAEPDGYDRVVVCNLGPWSGVRLVGLSGLYTNRFLLGEFYTSAPLSPPIASKLSSVGIWRYPPRTLV